MAQMSEAARKRRNELCVDLTEDALTKHNEGDEQQNAFKVVVFDALKKAYEAGMQDPDANDDIISERERMIQFHLKTVKELEAVVEVKTGVVEELMKDCAELDYARELLDECERLLKVFKEHSRECADDFSFVWSDAIHDAGKILEKLREARK